jgi:hypothetical protein
MAPTSRSGPRPLLALALLVAVWFFARSWNAAPRWVAIDFYQFWVVGDVVRGGEPGDVWSAPARVELGQRYAERAALRARGEADGAPPPRQGAKRAAAAREREELETYSTPWLYTVFAFLGDGRYSSDQALFERLSLVLYLAALLALAASLGFSAVECALLASLSMSMFGPFLEDESLGNVSRLQFALLAAVAWLLARRWKFARLAAGVVLGLTIAFKPNIAVAAVALGLGWMFSGQWRKLAEVLLGALVGVALAVAISSARFGTAEAWSWWARELAALMQPGAWDGSNYTLARLLRESFASESATFVGALLALGLGACLWTSRRSVAKAVETRDERSAEFLRDWDVLLMGLGATLGLLASELSWFHYYASALLLVLALLRPARDAEAPAAARLRQFLGGAGLVALSLEIPRLLLELPDGAGLPLVVGGALLAYLGGCAVAARGFRAA